MAERQSRAIPVLHLNTDGLSTEVAKVIEDLRRDTQAWLQRLSEGVDQAVGLRGEPRFYASVDAQGHEIRGLGRPTTDDSAQTRRYSLSLDENGTAYDARGRAIRNVPVATVNTEAVPLSQLASQLAGSLEASRGVNAPPEVAAASAVGSVLTRWSREDHEHGVDNGTFSVGTTGFSVDPTGDATYVLIGLGVILFLPQLTGTSDATTFTVTGLPAGLTPVKTTDHVVRIVDNGTAAFGIARLTDGSTTVTLFPNAAAGNWTNSGTKTLIATMIAYNLVDLP